jgi:hypothetical protein
MYEYCGRGKLDTEDVVRTFKTQASLIAGRVVKLATANAEDGVDDPNSFPSLT